MADETVNIITQPKDERFALDHGGGVALYGERERPPMQHELNGQVAHSTPKPLIHMVYWQEEQTCKVELSGNVTLSGDKARPIEVHMAHLFANEHQQRMHVEPFEHTMRVATQPAEPIHHSLAMRTPLELRFCNPWTIDSRYQVDVTMGESRLLTILLRGTSVCRPQPCDDQRPTPPINVNPRPG